MINRTEKGQFQKGITPWNKGTKGLVKFPNRVMPKKCMDAILIYRQQQKDKTFQRFNESFEIDDQSNCWVWKNEKGDKRGYKRFNHHNTFSMAHRFSYEMYIGEIPEGLTLDHLCRNTRCVNPLHLEPVTLLENLRRGDNQIIHNAEKKYCKFVHPYSGDNLYIKPNGERDCKTCRNLRTKKYLLKKQENKII